MKLGFSCVHRKLSKVKRSMSVEDVIYYLDEEDRIIGHYTENVLTLFMQGTDKSYKLLTLAFNYKYKCGQDVIIADVAFISDFIDNKLPVVVKSRDIRYKEDILITKHGFSTIGTAYLSNEELHVSIPDLGVNSVQEKVVHREKEPFLIFNILTRKIH